MRKKISLLTILAVAAAPMIALSLFTLNVNAITTMSITGTGITANSSDVSTAVTPTVNFTTTVAQVTDGSTIQVTLNGMVVAAGQTLDSSDITLTGCTTSNTLEASPGTADNDTHEVTVTNGASGNSNPEVLITLDNDGVTPPNCTATAYTVAVAASQLESNATASNYAIGVDTSQEAASFFYYVGDENDVTVTATVDPTLSFTIRNSADTADQANVGGAAVGPNVCDLGNLSTAGVQTCDYRLKVTSNAASGYTVNIETDGSLRKGADFIDNVTEDTTVTGGAEDYGIAFAAGTYDPDGAGGVFSPTACTESTDFDDDDTPTATALAVGVNQTLYSCAGPNAPDATDTGNTALVTHRAEADAATPAGTYTQLVTYTATATF